MAKIVKPVQKQATPVKPAQKTPVQQPSKPANKK